MILLSIGLKCLGTHTWSFHLHVQVGLFSFGKKSLLFHHFRSLLVIGLLRLRFVLRQRQNPFFNENIVFTRISIISSHCQTFFPKLCSEFEMSGLQYFAVPDRNYHWVQNYTLKKYAHTFQLDENYQIRTPIYHKCENEVWDCQTKITKENL